jgi:hypothetical protein
MLESHVTLPTARADGILARILRAVWTLPTNVLGHAIGLVVSGELPRRVGGRAARGWVYPIREGLPLHFIGAITLGHAIVHRRGMFDGLEGRLVLAHELAHTRQHDWLGPFYLPLHVTAQTISFAVSLFSGPPVFSRVHDHNPLEQTFIAISAGATRAWPITAQIGIEAFLAEFGV